MQQHESRKSRRAEVRKDRIAWCEVGAGPLRPGHMVDISDTGVGFEVASSTDLLPGSVIRAISRKWKFPRRARVVRMAELTQDPNHATRLGCEWVGVKPVQERGEPRSGTLSRAAEYFRKEEIENA